MVLLCGLAVNFIIRSHLHPNSLVEAGRQKCFLVFVQLLSCVQLSVTPWTAACQALGSFTISRSLLRFMSTESGCYLTFSSSANPFSICFQSFPETESRVFSNESALCIRWPKYWSFSFSISPSNEYSGLNSFRMDWLGLLAVQETLKGLPQQPNSKASFLWCSDFFMVQVSHLYKTTEKSITLTLVG